MNITIDGIDVSAKEGMSVLDAALEAQIYIPHLCKHPDLEAVGGCRLCVVEIDESDEVVPSCKTIVRDGMRVIVHGQKADIVRKMAMELILATHPAECTGCPKYGKCELQSMYQYMGVSPERWRKKSRVVPNDDSNPLIQHLFTRCVRCGRCIRACRELRGVKVLDYQRTKDGIRAGVDEGKTLKDAGCKFCGACIEVCPTGSIMDAVGIIRDDAPYSQSVVPCKGACPAGVDIPRYIRYVKNGEFEKAIAVVRETVPFPEILGSICSHACEDKCKRNELNEPLSICRLKRVSAAKDNGVWKTRQKMESPAGKKVAIIGGGPSGLTAAYYLAKNGHTITVFEQNEKAGGQCRYGIPAYRLPDSMLDKEIAVILETGIDLRTNTAVGNPSKLLEDGFDAVLISVGTNQGSVLPIEGNDLTGVLINTTFLKGARMKTPIPLGERVMVLGGGNVAYDCARTARRLGAKEVHIACLESLDTMTASKEERLEGEEEGIILHEASSFLQITGADHVEGVELQKVKSFTFRQGQAIVELVEDSQEIIPVDTVILAVGQKPAGTGGMGVELVRNAYIKTDDTLQTNISGIFAAGDVVTGTKSVIEAIDAGRKSAIAIDRYLGGTGDIAEVLVEPEAPDQYIGRESVFADLTREYPNFLCPSERETSFEPVEAAFTDEAAGKEAERCLQCDLRLTLTSPKLWNEY